jgi:mRNA-degrading endonuclease RelE of RelBE toxin-antitoxin system
MPAVPYRIEYSPEADDHLNALTAHQRTLVVKAVDKHLQYQPTVETRNRKEMKPTPLAPWELRIRNLRVYYEVMEEPEPLVYVRAIGVKVRSQVWIGGEEVEFREDNGNQ